MSRFRLFSTKGHQHSRRRIPCVACHAIVDTLHYLWNLNLTEDAVAQLIALVCTKAHVEDERVCKSIAQQMRDEVLYIIGQTVLDPRQVCGILFDHCGKPYDPVFGNWTIAIDANKPPVQSWPQPEVLSVL